MACAASRTIRQGPEYQTVSSCTGYASTYPQWAPQGTSFLKALKAHFCAIPDWLKTSAQGTLIGKMHAMRRWHAPFCASLLRTLLLQHQNRLLPSAVACSRLSVLHWLYPKLSGKTGLRIITAPNKSVS